MTRYAKSIVALLGAVATWGVTAGEDSTYTQVELWGALLALTTAAAVFFVPNAVLDEAGHVNTALITCVAVVAIAVVAVLYALGELPL